MKSIADNVLGLRVMLTDNAMAYEIGTYREPQNDTINNTQTDCATTSLLVNSAFLFWLSVGAGFSILSVTADLFANGSYNVAFCCSLAILILTENSLAIFTIRVLFLTALKCHI